MIMAAMYLAGKYEKNNPSPDYDAIERAEEENDNVLLEEQKYIEQKYYKENLGGNMCFRANIYIPAYDERVDCLIADANIEVFHITKDDKGEEQIDWLNPGWGQGAIYLDKDVASGIYWLNDHTDDINPDIAKAMGYVISWGIYFREKQFQKAKECISKANSILKDRNCCFNPKGDCLRFEKLGSSEEQSVYELVAKGIVI